MPWLRLPIPVSRLAPSVLLLLAAISPATAPATAAVIEQRQVTITLDGAGESYLRQDSLRVAITEPGDLDTWQEYTIRLDAHIELLSCTAEVLDAAGKVVHRVPRRSHQRIESPGFALHRSAWLSVVPFPPLTVGQTVRLVYQRRWRPLFPAASVGLLTGSEQRQLRVRVEGAPRGFRWQLASADDETFTVSERAGGLDLEATQVAAYDPPRAAPHADLSSPVLRLAWGGISTWQEVGAWYHRLIGPRAVTAEVAALARDLCRDGEPARACVEAVAGHVKRQVRYEAVEINEGRWVPTPAAEVLQRGWGDCKDKSQLVKQLLATAGIPAHLVLIRAGTGGDLDTRFPWTGLINHCIVAVPAGAAGATEEDPVGDGYLFIDPTQDMGGVSWLTPSCQARTALLVKDGTGELVKLPVRSAHERRHLRVEGEIRPAGGLACRARLMLTGSRAVPWIRDLRSKPQERTEEDARGYFTSIFPAATVSALQWRELPSETPSFELTAELLVPEVGQGRPGRRAVRPLGLTAILSAGALDERTVPVVLRLGEHTTEWQVRLPDDWCPAVAGEVAVDNQVGSFTQTAASQGQVLHLSRRTVLRRTLVAVDELDVLRELAVAESRADKRRLRLRCPTPAETGDASGPSTEPR